MPLFISFYHCVYVSNDPETLVGITPVPSVLQYVFLFNMRRYFFVILAVVIVNANVLNTTYTFIL